MGLATKAVMGFSPTVWASGYRTGWIMNFAFLFCTVFMLREWDFKNKNATCLLMGITAVCGVSGMIINYYSCMSI